MVSVYCQHNYVVKVTKLAEVWKERDAPAETATILMSPRHISPWSPLGQSCQRYGEKEGVREKSGAIGMATAAKLVSHKCTAMVKVFRGTEPQSLH